MKNEAMVKSQAPKAETCKQFVARKSLALFMCVMVVMCSLVAASADTTVIDSSAWQTVLDSLTAQISVATVVSVLTVIAAACVGLVFMWWGVRKATHALMAAFRKGKISI